MSGDVALKFKIKVTRTECILLFHCVIGINVPANDTLPLNSNHFVADKNLGELNPTFNIIAGMTKDSTYIEQLLMMTEQANTFTQIHTNTRTELTKEHDNHNSLEIR